MMPVVQHGLVSKLWIACEFGPEAGLGQWRKQYICSASGPRYSYSATSVIWCELWISTAATCNFSIILWETSPLLAWGMQTASAWVLHVHNLKPVLDSFLLLITNSKSEENLKKKIKYSIGYSTMPLGLWWRLQNPDLALPKLQFIWLQFTTSLHCAKKWMPHQGKTIFHLSRKSELRTNLNSRYSMLKV